MDRDIQDLDGQCHCGTVRFHVKLTNGLHTARRCNCSYCRMRGAVAVSSDLDGFKILAGEEALTLYLFNTQSAKHFFCSKCGIYTHHQRRSIPTQFGVNAACLNGLSPFDFEEVPVLNGLAHPADHREGARAYRVGVLKFVPEEGSASS